MENYLRRRGAFWDNWRHTLDAALSDLTARSAERWVEADDAFEIDNIKELLRGALLISMRRYRDVLGEQIEAMQGEEAESCE